MPRHRLLTQAAAAVVALTTIVCGVGATNAGAASVTPTKATSGPLGSSCAPASLKTVKAGEITIGVDDPLYQPWFGSNNPTTGKGYEDAVDYAIAKELGYPRSAIGFTRVTFNDAIQPGPKSFDYDLDEFTITAARAKEVDFSAPYYTVAQAVVGVKGSAAAKSHTLAAVKKLQLGAQVGSTSYSVITNQIKPVHAPRVYNNNNDAEAALQDGQIQGLVMDLPTAFEVTTGEVKGTTIIGQLPLAGQPSTFGALLNLDSPLTACVSKAVEALQTNGTLATLQTKWLAKVGKAPELK
jgi:polar amino acid transport system substrate-binding protein